jgi:hypothetical protein
LHYLFDFRFLELFLFFERFFGTFMPSALASERPIAIACLRLLTFRPERPLFRVPALRFFIARPTLADAFFEYFRAMIILPVAEKVILAKEDGSRFDAVIASQRVA